MPKGWLLLLGAALLQTAAHGSEILINLTNQVWRYDQSGVFHDTFAEPLFDDSMWAEGRSILAFEASTGNSVLEQNVFPYTNTVLIPPNQAPGNPNHIVDYFRTRFTFSGAGAPDTWVLTLSNLVDDAYVAYLNGVEVERFNMNPANDMLAAAAGPQPEGIYVVRQMCIPAGTLVRGENVLAVRVHQNTGSSSDVVWGTVLHASPGAAPAVLWPTSDINIMPRQGANTNLVVNVQAAPCAIHQWHKNNQAIPGATSTSFSITNMDANQAGTYFLRSVNAVGTVDSPNFVVTYADDVTSPTVVSASADPWDPSVMRVTFSEDVLDLFSNPPFDPLPFYIEDRDNFPGDIISANSVAYGVSSNVAIVTLAEPRNPAIRYQLVIITHGIEDRFGNPMSDPTVVPVTVPVVFQNGTAGYVGTQDTEVRFSSPDSAAGGQAATLLADAEDGAPVGQVHSLLRFENIVPFGAIINNATLRIYTDDQGTRPTRVMRMLANWDESSTWNSMANGINQTNSVEAVQINTVDGSDEGQPRVFDDIDVTATVQAWVNGEPNYGFGFLPTGTDGWRWVSSENATVAERPSLIIDAVDMGETWCLIYDHPKSVTVTAGEPFTLSVTTSGPIRQWQWFRNSMPIPDATNRNYRVASARPSDAGRYHVTMRTITSECTSLPANVTVLCHGDSPALVSAVGNADQTTISLVFNDTLDKASAEAVTNYTISGGLSIVSASNNATKVTLTTDGPRTLGSNYMLTVANVRDDSICLNRIYPNPTVITLAQDVRVLSFDAVWKYHNEGQDLGTVWRDPNYNDSAWPQGPGPLGFETTPEIIPLITTWISRTNQVGDPIITDYFRALLNVPFESSGVTFTIRHRVDDGAVFYFNGAEVARFNMPTGVINFATTAPTPPGEGVVRSLTNLTGLAAGPNSFAVEAHQTSLSSTDVLFGAEVIARVPWFLEPQSHLSIVRDADGTVTISWLSQSMVLQESPAVDGPWTNVQGAVSPMRILVPSGNRFYRLRAF